MAGTLPAPSFTTNYRVHDEIVLRVVGNVYVKGSPTLYIVMMDEYSVPGSAMTASEKKFLPNEQAKDRPDLLMFMASDFKKAKSILLASTSQEMLRSLVNVLNMDDNKVVVTKTWQICLQYSQDICLASGEAYGTITEAGVPCFGAAGD